MRDVISLTRRNLVHVAREPAQLSDATIQPILFTVLFVYIFGSAMVIPGGGSYTNFAIGGLVTMNVTTASMGTAVGLSSDLSSGVINRFRTLPMARSAILAGRTLSDLLAAMLCATIVVITGWVIGWRPENGLAGVVAGLAVAVLFAYALSWFTACIGLHGERSGVGAGRRADDPVPARVRVDRARARRRDCPTGCASSPTGTRCRPSPDRAASCSATRTPPRCRTRSRRSIRCSSRWCGAS